MIASLCLRWSHTPRPAPAVRPQAASACRYTGSVSAPARPRSPAGGLCAVFVGVAVQSPHYQTPVITAVYVGAGVVIGAMLVFSLFPWAYVLGAVGVVGAVVLCPRGLRGRVLRLPACPACGYDMRHRTGLTCPECGHTVEHAQNLRRRERRPGLIAAGLACLLLLTPAGMQLRGVNVWSMAPAWVLLTACSSALRTRRQSCGVARGPTAWPTSRPRSGRDLLTGRYRGRCKRHRRRTRLGGV